MDCALLQRTCERAHVLSQDVCGVWCSGLPYTQESSLLKHHGCHEVSDTCDIGTDETIHSLHCSFHEFNHRSSRFPLAVPRGCSAADLGRLAHVPSFPPAGVLHVPSTTCVQDFSCPCSCTNASLSPCVLVCVCVLVFQVMLCFFIHLIHGPSALTSGLRLLRNRC